MRCCRASRVGAARAGSHEANVGKAPEHLHLGCGIDLAVLPLGGRSVAAVEVRVIGGYAYEEPAFLGVTSVLEEAISKGTQRRDGRALNDAFDAIGATHSSCAGRETVAFSTLCLAEFLDQAVSLTAEMIRTPTFPKDACEVAVELTRQSLAALNDDPQELAKKLLHQQAYGQPLGRHVLGEEECLARIGRDQVVAHWQRYFVPGRMLVAVAGQVETAAVADLFERAFECGDPGSGDPTTMPLQFTPGRSHHQKELEQVQIGICWPGSGAADPDFAVEQVTIGVLAGGMSGRLFTEIREKQGLVYWVGAWSDQPRRSGVVHVGASCTPENVEKTYSTLLREIDRLDDDLAQDEVNRAINGIVTRTLTRGEVTRARAAEMIDDLFYRGRPIPTEEKLDRVRRVTVEDVRRYLADHPRERLSALTLGPSI